MEFELEPASEKMVYYLIDWRDVDVGKKEIFSVLPSWVDAYIGYRAKSKSGRDVIAAPHWVMPVKVA